MIESKTSIVVNDGDLTYIKFKIFENKGVKHCFTTRLGGVSKGHLKGMNMSFYKGDSPENVRKNYEIICDKIGIDTANLVFTKQTHTTNVLSVTEKDRGVGYTRPSFSDIDGLVTDKKGVALVTQFADCVPLLFFDFRKKVIASSHSGWRGTVGKIGEKTVEKMVNEFGCKRKDILVAIGPSISGECYEVGEDVYKEFIKNGFNKAQIFTEKGNGKYLLDLKTANKQILVNCGILPQNIEVCDICTHCQKDIFSHRVLGEKRGNNAAIIELL